MGVTCSSIDSFDKLHSKIFHFSADLDKKEHLTNNMYVPPTLIICMPDLSFSQKIEKTN